jgi:hypothetical protein
VSCRSAESDEVEEEERERRDAEPTATAPAMEAMEAAVEVAVEIGATPTPAAGGNDVLPRGAASAGAAVPLLTLRLCAVGPAAVLGSAGSELDEAA